MIPADPYRNLGPATILRADLSADYNRFARWRITDLDQLAAVQGHERTKREPDTDDLLTLLDDGGAA